MKQILHNLALVDAINFCKEQNIDCSGTYLYKYPRRFTYALLRSKDGKAIVTTTFHKNQVPTHTVTYEQCGVCRENDCKNHECIPL